MTGLSYKALFEQLNSSRCGFVVVGGLAVILHGHARLTTDTDLVVDLSAAELPVFLDVLDNLGFRPRVPVELRSFGNPELRRLWQQEKGMQVFSLFHPEQPRWVIDLFTESPIAFDDLSRRSVLKEIEGTAVRVASIDDLIAMKRIADRDIDRSDIESLKQIKEMEGDYRI
jgi:hypothetical protein